MVPKYSDRVLTFPSSFEKVEDLFKRKKIQAKVDCNEKKKKNKKKNKNKKKKKKKKKKKLF